MSTSPQLVVGAGASGLGCAIALASKQTVVLLDRLPVCGGRAGWRDPDIRDLVGRAHKAGVELRLGGTALRWDGARLLVAAPGKIYWEEGVSLFFAGGLRPSTAADIGLYGERPAGIVPASVAEHLLAAGVPIWHRAFIIGHGPWARHVAEQIHDLGGSVATTAPTPAWADEAVDAQGGLDILGLDHVRAIRTRSSSGSSELACDGVVLASDPRPTRNVEGAIEEGERGVTFVQSLEGESVQQRAAVGGRIALEWLGRNGGHT